VRTIEKEQMLRNFRLIDVPAEGNSSILVQGA
jgi:hypothetical protein